MYIYYNKFTTINNDISVDIWENPGGSLWEVMLVMKSLPNETPKILSLPSTKNPVSSSQFWYKNSVEDFDEEHEGNIQTDNSCLMTNYSRYWTRLFKRYQVDVIG